MFLLIVLVGITAGLHAALYGAYKDSPHESFMAHRFAREVVIAAIVTAALAALGLFEGETLFIVYLSAFALSRITTEFWKLFVRVEPQSEYRIPTQVHWLTGVVTNPFARLLMGAGYLASIYGIYCACKLLPTSLPAPVYGAIVGLAFGTAEAIGGGYKDGSIEGFSWYKFAKSPTFGALSGVIVSSHAESLAFLSLATIGSMRMFLELLFKIFPKDYVPGKFASMAGPFKEWWELRRHFLPPYAATWMLYLVLLSRPGW